MRREIPEETGLAPVLFGEMPDGLFLADASDREVEPQDPRVTEPATTMKSLVLYGSTMPLTNAHIRVTPFFQQSLYYVRVETFNGDMQEALQKAKPMLGETVLNTVEIKSETPTS